jgi:hypothetical protein
MPIRRTLFFVAVCVLLSHALPYPLLGAANPESTPTIHDRVAGMKVADGLFPTAWDAKTGHFFVTVRKFDQDFLFVISLPYGLGSNDIGLDRGLLGRERVRGFCWSRPIWITDRPPQTRWKTLRCGNPLRIQFWPASKWKRKMRMAQC